jgi:WD40 repeat protein
LHLWSAITGAPGPILEGPPEGLLSVAYQPDGAWLVGAGEDGAVWVWNAAALAIDPAQLRGHRNEVNAVAFSQDGKLMASAGADALVVLWDTTDPAAEPDQLRTSGASVNTVAFGPGNGWVASGGADGAIRRWTLSVDALIEEACRTAGRNLRVEEWRQYFPTDANTYRRTCPALPSPSDEPEGGEVMAP